MYNYAFRVIEAGKTWRGGRALKGESWWIENYTKCRGVIKTVSRSLVAFPTPVSINLLHLENEFSKLCNKNFARYETIPKLDAASLKLFLLFISNFSQFSR